MLINVMLIKTCNEYSNINWPALCEGFIPIPSERNKKINWIIKTTIKNHILLKVSKWKQKNFWKWKKLILPFVIIALVAGGTLNWR